MNFKFDFDTSINDGGFCKLVEVRYDNGEISIYDQDHNIFIPIESLPKEDQIAIKEKVTERTFMESASDDWEKKNAAYLADRLDDIYAAFKRS